MVTQFARWQFVSYSCLCALFLTDFSVICSIGIAFCVRIPSYATVEDSRLLSVWKMAVLTEFASSVAFTFETSMAVDRTIAVYRATDRRSWTEHPAAEVYLTSNYQNKCPFGVYAQIQDYCRSLSLLSLD